MSEFIQFEKSNGVGYITLNRPDKLNSFNREMAFAMQKALDECQEDDSIRAIYLTGNGKGFCAGQDLAEVVAEDGPELTDIVKEHYNPIIERIRNVEMPVVCAVNGVAAGAGANVALACDVVVAAETVKFIQAFSAIGLIPDSAGTYFLPRLIGFGKASALMMLGDRIEAKAAEDMGMIYKAVPNEELTTAAKAIAERLAQMPTRGLWLTKKALNESMNNSLSEQLALEGVLQTEAGETHDYNEGVSAFLEKRKPVFKGK